MQQQKPCRHIIYVRMVEESAREIVSTNIHFPRDNETNVGDNSEDKEYKYAIELLSLGMI